MRAHRIDWDSIRTVLLDLDGTLLDLGFDNWFWQELVPMRWGVINGVPLAEAQRRLHPRFRDVEGTLDWYSLDHWTRELGFDVAALKREVEHEIRVNPHVTVFLDAVRGLGKRIVLVTDAHGTTLEIKLARTGLGGRFDALYSSHAFGVPKSHAGFWGELAGHESFLPGAALLVDDSPPVLAAARDYGIGTIIAVSRPDRTRPPRHMAGFPSVADLSEITP